jgi:hypothetical protein
LELFKDAPEIFGGIILCIPEFEETVSSMPRGVDEKVGIAVNVVKALLSRGIFFMPS